MCGICGFTFEDKSLLKKMCNIIAYRGPDDEGYYSNNEISLGMRRLSIIDLTSGHQPQHNENEDIWVIFNGEIYNYKELREELKDKGHNFYTESDTEVIVHSYEEWSFDFIKKFNGEFAFSVYDANNNLLILAKDHLGIKPLYYYFNGKNLIFSSEIKSILCCGIKKEIDKEALNQYLSLRYSPFEKTLFKRIYKVPPASILKFDLKKKNIEIKKYWDLVYNINNYKTESQFAAELKNILEESVKVRLRSDVPLGAFLSGGIDSSAIVGIMSKYTKEPIKTFSIAFKQGAAIDESKYSKFVADYFNTDHTELIIDTSFEKEIMNLIWHFDDLINDLAFMWIYILAKNAKKKISVALTGDGADEVFAGYFPGYKVQRYSFLNSIPKKMINNLMKYYDYIPSHKVRMTLSYLNLSHTEEDIYFRGILQIPDEEKREIFRFNVDNVKDLIKEKFISGLDNITQFINWDLFYQLPNLYNMKLDKSAMAASLEARVPFLDKNLVTWASTVPSNLKLKNDTEKYILRLALKDILPKQILKRKKFGFGTPANYWLKNELYKLSGEILERLEKRNYLINSYYVKKIRKNRTKGIYVNRILNLIMFELWYETFFENDGLKPVEF